MIVEIRRTHSNVHGTFGVLSVDGLPFCVTLEETWLDNIQNDSCIPEGIYQVRDYYSEKYPDAWSIENVQGRTNILIHKGNTERDTAGCILVGKYFAKFGDRKGVADSRNTMLKLKSALPDNFKLNIVDCF